MGLRWTSDGISQIPTQWAIALLVNSQSSEDPGTYLDPFPVPVVPNSVLSPLSQVQAIYHDDGVTAFSMDTTFG